MRAAASPRVPDGTTTWRRPLHDWWVATAVLALMLVSDFRFRVRDVTSSISGRPDFVVVVEVLVYGLVALWLLSAFHWRPQVRSTSLLAAAAWAFAALYASTALYAPFPLLGLVRAGQLLLIAALGQTLAGHATRRQLHRFAHGLMMLVAVAAASGVVWPAHQAEYTVQRFSWLAVHPVLSASYLSLALVASVAYLAVPGLRAQGPGWPPVVYAVLLAVFAGALFENRTRGSIIAAAVGVLAVLLTGVRRVDRSAVLPGLALVGSTVFAVLGLERLQIYIERGQSASSLATLNFRTTLWGQALHVWRQAPFTGQGLGATRGVFLESTGLGGGHNAFINVLVDSGAVGAALWLALLAVLTRAVWLLRRRLVGMGDQPLLLGLLGCLLVNGLTTEGLGESANVAMIVLFVLVGWVGALQRQDRGRWVRPAGAPPVVPRALAAAAASTGQT